MAKNSLENMIATMFLCLCICLCAFVHTCAGQNATYWYILNPGVYNFSNYTIAYATSIFYNLPLHARDGAIITANDTVPTITGIFTLIGDVNNGINAFVTVELLQSPVFLLTGGADVYMRNLQFAFNGTLFNTRQNSLLRLSSVNLWIGGLGAMLQTNSGPGVGFMADHLQCMNLQICILYLSTSTATCTDCRFMNPRSSAVSVSSTAASAIAGLTITNSLWINTQFFIYAQSSPKAVPVTYPLPSNWGYLYNNIIARTYQQDCVPPSQSQTPSFKAGGAIPSGECPSCNCNPNGGPSTWQIVLLVLLGLVFIIVAVINVNSQFAQNSQTFTAVQQTPSKTD